MTLRESTKTGPGSHNGEALSRSENAGQLRYVENWWRDRQTLGEGDPSGIHGKKPLAEGRIGKTTGWVRNLEPAHKCGTDSKRRVGGNRTAKELTKAPADRL